MTCLFPLAALGLSFESYTKSLKKCCSSELLKSFEVKPESSSEVIEVTVGNCDANPCLPSLEGSETSQLNSKAKCVTLEKPKVLNAQNAQMTAAEHQQVSNLLAESFMGAMRMPHVLSAKLPDYNQPLLSHRCPIRVIKSASLCVFSSDRIQQADWQGTT